MATSSRKRMRLSSPTYEDGLDEVDDETFDLLEKIEFSHSQQQSQRSPRKQDNSDEERVQAGIPAENSSSQPKPPSSSQAASPGAKARRMKAIQAALAETEASSRSTKDKVAGVGVGVQRATTKTANTQRHFKRIYTPTSPDDDFGLGKTTDSFTGTQTALSPPGVDDVSITTGFPGFSSAGPSAVGFAAAGAMTTGTLQVSEEAMKRAQMRMEEWSKEIDAEVHVDEDDVPSSPTKTSPSKKPKPNADVRPPLASIGNSPKTHSSPVAQGFGAPKAFTTPIMNRTAKTNGQKPFKSPLLRNASPRKQNNHSRFSSPSKPQRPHPLSSTPINGSLFSGFKTPPRPFSVGRPSKSTFSTPFKPGLGPGEPGRLMLEMSHRTPVKTPVKVQSTPRPKPDLALDPHTLRGCGKVPQSYTFEELEDLGLNISELTQITPQTAPFYSFHTSSNLFPSTQMQQASASGVPHKTLGPAEAYEHIIETGRYTTREWVDNQWVLVLWKLAGLAALDPDAECDPATRRWCWRSVLDQLEKRHDKEYGRGARPALRKITTEDSDPGVPMVLVVSGLVWSQHEKVDSRGRVLEEACAEIEVSDGWYRLRALVDAPLARAVLKGLIIPGRKLAVAGAKLNTGGRDPREVLDAYDTCVLELSGNSTHLAPWYAKLGFRKEPFYATLRSLTPDGGAVPMIGLVIEKVYPIAYFEYFRGSKPKDKGRMEGPRSEAEEAEIHDAWQKRYDTEESKIRERCFALWDKWDGLAERLEDRSRHFVPIENDLPPDDIDDQYEELNDMPPNEVPNYCKSLTAYESYWLARYFRRKSALERDFSADDIGREMKDLVPPREVRSFRIVAVRDAYTERKPALRLCHLTIWDVLSLCVSEGAKPGALEIGQRFVVSNLQPAQHRSWMGQAKDDMVYLTTRKNSRFFWLK